MTEIFVEEDVEKIDICQAYQDAEEWIMEEMHQQGSKIYSKVIWGLIYQYEKRQKLYKNPMHVCKILETFEAEKVNKRILTNNWLLSDLKKIDFINFQSLKKTLNEEKGRL